MKMKSVCIIGAGPAGLVATKTLLQTGQFKVTCFEKKSRIGGIWALDEHTTDGFLSPQTPTNLSRFTVGFADLDWNSVELTPELQNGLADGHDHKPAPPMFPKAWQANRYLETYRHRYIPEDNIHLSCEVVKAERVKDPNKDGTTGWRVTTKDAASHTKTEEFNYLILASGFFSRPRPLERVAQGLDSSSPASTCQIIHSSEFRSLKDLFPDASSARGKKILILGGGNSSGETAAGVAMQLSNARWGLQRTSNHDFEDCKIVHVTPRPMYALPPFNEYGPGSRSYVPLDLKLYDFSKRPPTLESYAGKQPPKVRDTVHKLLQSMVGGDQSDLGADALVSRKGPDRGAAYGAITESYAEFVRGGLIEVVAGRVTAIQSEHQGPNVFATVNHGQSESTISDIGSVIYATGYTPADAIDFLADDVKSDLQYDSESARLPLILEQWQTMNKTAPDIAFLGFYEGPYWPVLEMTARLTAARWLNDAPPAPTRPFETQEALLELRKSMEDRSLDVPQFWFQDYLGYMEDMANHLRLQRNAGDFAAREGCPSPARYLTAQTNRKEANGIMDELHGVWHDCVTNGKYVPRAAFRALQGNWTISRSIESAHAGFSGTLEGTASFHPRFPTKDQSGRSFDLEYLYVESGAFTPTDSSHSVTASRRYVYRYSETDDELSVWFVKPDNDFEVDYLFHQLEFIKPAEARKAGASIGKADHLCADDMYWTEYRFPLRGIALLEFQVKHTVRGPNKDYVATTQYVRPNKE